jgi:hypothetical protein
MNVDNAAVFLSGTILYAVGFLIILVCIVVANNIIHKFWKSFGWVFIPYWFTEQPRSRFMTQDEAAKIAPSLDSAKK